MEKRNKPNGRLSSKEKMAQKMMQQQKQILDQHHSNNSMMNIFSTLESLELCLNDQKPIKAEKIYGYYDKVNYDRKSVE